MRSAKLCATHRTSAPRLAVACALTALALTACGSTKKPEAGQVRVSAGEHAGRGVVDDPRTKHMKCLQQHHLAVVRTVNGADRLPGMQIGAPPAGPSVTFEPTPGAAQQAQISGSVQGAEVIGSALLFPNQASDQELKVVEDCMALGVTG
jgi:hypothetical protein